MSIIMNSQPLQSTPNSISSLWVSYFACERITFVTCQSLKCLYFALFSQNFQTKRLIFSEYLTTYIHLNPGLGSPKHALKQTYKSKLTIPYLIYGETDSTGTTVWVSNKVTLNPRGSTSHIVKPTLILAKISTSGPYNC